MTLLRDQEQNDFASGFANTFEARGALRGETTALLAVLDARGIEVPDDIRDRITTCTEFDQLDIWIRRAATIDKIQDLDEQFGDTH